MDWPCKVKVWLFAGHAVQVANPDVAAYVLARHVVQVDEPAGAAEPAKHTEHAREAPIVPEDMYPELQAQVQALVALLLLAGQFVHALLASEYLPAVQPVHCRPLPEVPRDWYPQLHKQVPAPALL